MQNNNYNYGARTFEEEYATIKGMNAFITKVFGWMFIGLLLSAGVAYYVSTNINIVSIVLGNSFIFFGLMIGEIILVSVLSARITRLKYGTAVSMFLIYAALNGITLSVIFLAYTQQSLVTAFAITAATFGAMCVYGYFTKVDLTQFRSLLFMGLIGLVILSIVNIFLRSSGVEWFISILSLFVFLGLTAYDMQSLKAYYFGTEGDMVLRRNLGIIGALRLYLDFINLFLTILRLSNRRK
ncbi:MAG: Bax inhibitor-1/YccA family protein [Clostridiaceae bacterium]|jgi:FtsH-binding integral membrane protein|nr:Bax inhibitor-1/YccA family protein [Clostridiaceae bacterium]